MVGGAGCSRDQGAPLYSVQGANGQIHTVAAPWDAYVVSVVVTDGQLVEPGTPIATLEQVTGATDPLEAVVFVPAGAAPTIPVGAGVTLTAAAAPSAAFGTLRGTVASVGNFPETTDSLQAFLGQGTSTGNFLAAGSVVRVVIKLATVPGSPTKLVWSKAAPGYTLNSESSVQASFVVARQHPISWLLGSMSEQAGGKAAARAARPSIPRRRRKHTPTVIQMEAVECGAASLGIILGHYGRYVPLEELRQRCGVSRDGSTAASMLRAARRSGSRRKGMQLDTGDLPRLPLPAVLFWKFNHFLVLEGYGRKVRLNDPATGPRSVPWDEFDKSFTGIAVTMQPGPDFKRGGERRRVLAALLARRPRLGSVLYLTVLLGLVVAIAGLTMPILTRVFVDDVLLGGGQSALGGLIVALAIATGLTLFASMLQQSLLVRAEAVFALGSAARFVRHLLSLPVAFFDQRQAADLTNRVRSNDVVADVLARRLASTAVDCMLVVAYGVLLVRYDVVLGLLAVVFAGLNIAVLRYVSAVRTSAVAGLQAERGKLFTTVFTTIHHDRVDQGRRRGADGLPAVRQPRSRGNHEAAAAWPDHRRARRGPGPACRAEHSRAALDRRPPGPGRGAQHWPAHRHAGADLVDEPAGHQPDATGLTASGDDRRPEQAQGHRELPGSRGARRRGRHSPRWRDTCGLKA